MRITTKRIEGSIATLEESRLSHMHWAQYRAQGGEEDSGAGDEAFHRQAMADYDQVLELLYTLLNRRRRR